VNTLIPTQINEIVLVGPLGPDIIHPLSVLPQIAIDGGERFAHAPFLWVGDGDSLRRDPESPQIVKLNPKKDMSDLAYTYELLQKHPLQKIHLWGFLGGKLDHELFNLGEASLYLLERTQTQLLYYKEEITPVLSFYSPGSWEFSFHDSFSLGVIHQSQITLQGEIEYPISHQKTLRPLSSLGLSNKAQGKFLVESTAPFFIMRDSKR
jgi:thiamine pyrophosphokinase